MDCPATGYVAELYNLDTIDWMNNTIFLQPAALEAQLCIGNHYAVT